MTSIVRSISFPVEDLADVTELAQEHGGLSQLFRDLYRSVLDYRAANGRDPHGDELALVLNQSKAIQEERNEALARIRRERALERAEKASTRIQRRARAQAERASALPSRPLRVADERPLPETFEEWVQESHVVIHRFKEADAVADLRQIARAQDFDPDRFVRACRLMADAAQQNLRALPAPREVRQ